MRVFSQINGRALDEIRLQDLHVRCTIGLYPEEALRTQALRLQVTLYLDTRPAARDGRLQHTVDYAALAREISFILSHSRFRLLESAAEALATYILSDAASDQARCRIEAVELEIIKPEALRGAAIPSLRIFRQEQLPSDGPLIFAAPEAALLRFVLPPAASERLKFLGWHLKAIMPSEAGLSLDGQDISAGEEVCLEQIEQSFLCNKSDAPRSILGVATRDVRVRPHRGPTMNLKATQSLYN